MTANYPASILPPNATAVERAIDRASAAALERLPVYLIRWVKDPDSCPLALLPWLAWEYQVDTWNINWSEQKKRDAIKRAHYIHRHRGTVAAVRHALVDSPFGTDIVEWFNQNPKGDPYTFRLNVYQNDLPVTEYDQQDLKLAVLRARNLRSWYGERIRKIARRARGTQWERVQSLPGVTVSVAGASARALVPAPVGEEDRLVAKLQIGGTELPHDAAPGAPDETTPIIWVASFASCSLPTSNAARTPCRWSSPSAVARPRTSFTASIRRRACARTAGS